MCGASDTRPSRIVIVFIRPAFRQRRLMACINWKSTAYHEPRPRLLGRDNPGPPPRTLARWGGSGAAGLDLGTTRHETGMFVAAAAVVLSVGAGFSRPENMVADNASQATEPQPPPPEAAALPISLERIREALQRPGLRIPPPTESLA